jgi:antitoxin YefM
MSTRSSPRNPDNRRTSRGKTTPRPSPAPADRSAKSSGHDSPVRYPVRMRAITYTAARDHLASTMDRVCSDHNPVIITRKRDQAVVMMSLEDYESLQETAYLLRSPANAKRLSEGIEQLERGQGVMKELSELM